MFEAIQRNHLLLKGGSADAGYGLERSAAVDVAIAGDK